MTTGATPTESTIGSIDTPATVVGGGAFTSDPLPSFVTTTSLCTGHETLPDLCARVSTTISSEVSEPPLPATGSDLHDKVWGSSLIVLVGVIAACVARRGRVLR